MKSQKKIFCCYSVELRNFLYQRGIKYEVCALNPNNHQMFWVYVRDVELNKELTNWSNRKKG